MLIIGRLKGESLHIGNDIEIVVLDTGRGRVRFGIKAPREIEIHTKGPGNGQFKAKELQPEKVR